MIHLDEKKGKVEISGDSETIVNELGVAQIALLGSLASQDLDLAVKFYRDLMGNMAKLAVFLDKEYGVVVI